MNLPNALTVARIAASPLLFVLIFVPTFTARLLAFVLFVLAGASDVWDGYLARSRGQITNFGKLADPIADKLLLVVTFVPFYLLPRAWGDPVGAVPSWGPLHWGPLPLWVLLLVLGRELVVTLFRGYAARRGLVIPAGKAGKYKATFQNLFIGGLILWYALQTRALRAGWRGGFWDFWQEFHAAWVAVMLAGAVALTVASLAIYVWQYRRVVRGAIV